MSTGFPSLPSVKLNYTFSLPLPLDVHFDTTIYFHQYYTQHVHYFWPSRFAFLSACRARPAISLFKIIAASSGLDSCPRTPSRGFEEALRAQASYWVREPE